MPPWVVDLVITVLILGMTYALSSEGAWGAALMFFDVMFAGLIAFNFYEPLARLLAENASAFANWADLLCLFFLFFLSLVILRVATDQLAPGIVRLPGPVYQIGRLVFALGASLMTTAILLCIFQTAPVHKKILGVIDYQTGPPWGQGLDRKWLAFVQFSTGNTFPTYDESHPFDQEFKRANVFDPKGSWLIDHQNARPYQTEGQDDSVPPPEAGAAAPPAAGATPTP